MAARTAAAHDERVGERKIDKRPEGKDVGCVGEDVDIFTLWRKRGYAALVIEKTII